MDTVTNWLNHYGVTHYTVNSDLTIDVGSDVFLDKQHLNHPPFKFGHVRGHFYVCDNQLTSLHNCPNRVDWYFSCSNNRLASLEFAPKEVGQNFYASHNRLEHLQHLPQVLGDVRLNDNLLKDYQHISDYQELLMMIEKEQLENAMTAVKYPAILKI